jgi:putative phage-type endonuclease
MHTRDEWLEQRKKGIGGSDCAAALGQSRHMTATELYYQKVGGPVERDFDADGIERTEFGRAMEGVIASQYARRFGVRLRRRNAIIRHPRYPHMLANVDRLIEGKHEGLEIKNVDAMAYRFGGEWGEPGSDEIPVAYLLQVAHYMCVLNYPVWHVAACVGGNKLAVYHVERDPELEGMIIDGEIKFWTFVEEGEPPPLDYDHPHAVDFLKRLYRGTSGETVTLSPELSHWHEVKLEATEAHKRAEALIDGCKARILDAMGNAAIGVLPGVGEYVRKTVHRDAYSVEPIDYQTLTFRKPKAAKAREKTA